MTRACVSMLLCAALLAPGAALAAVPERPSTPLEVSGVYTVHFNLNIASTLPAGAVIVCKAWIVPNLQGLPSLGQPNAAPVQAAAGVAIVSGSTATCAVEIPFSWTVRNSQGGIALSYEIEDRDASGSLSVLLRATPPQGIATAYPSMGGAASLNFDLTF